MIGLLFIYFLTEKIVNASVFLTGEFSSPCFGTLRVHEKNTNIVHDIERTKEDIGLEGAIIVDKVELDMISNCKVE